QAWAMASGRYEGYPEDPAKWKTNFRCALSSTRMFKLLEDRSKCGDDPHKVFTVTPGERGPRGARVGLGPLRPTLPHTPPGSTDLPQSMLLEDLELLQLVLQHCDISCDLGPQPPPWEPRGDPPHQDALLQPHPDPGQNNGLPTSAFEEWVPVAEQHPMGTYSSPAPMLLEQPAVPLLCHLPQPAGPVPSPGQAMLFAPAASPAPPPPQESTGCPRGGLDRRLGRTFSLRGLSAPVPGCPGRSGCRLVYQPLDPAVALRPGHLLRFPSPDELPDQKQRQFTEKLLGSAGLQLEQRAHKLFATRLKKCRVFWALSQQLEGAREPPYNLLCRDQETPIFDFNEFCTELRRFRNGQRQQSPDFTIYLCFGQCLSNAKPKESKLILVKLVPKFCEYWYEQVLREGASSLDSGTVSLQLSDSFSLFELIEQCNMQLD
ncbi:Interferon regulatory factor 3, partial [Colius striatus]